MKTLLFSLLTTLGLSLTAAAEETATIELTGNDQMQYNKKELSVATGTKVTLKFEHVGKLPEAAMGHNVVILKPGTQLPQFAMKCAAAKDNDYIATDEATQALIVAHTEMIGGGEKTEMTFTAPEPGVYPYVCTFPGHFGVMNGKLTVTE